MTPSEIRDELEGIRALASGLEDRIREQVAANVLYYSICHEMAEADETLGRALDLVDEIGLRN